MDALIKALPEIGSQLLAFGIVFFILKKTAFGAISNILEERQKTIQNSLDSAEGKNKEAQALKDEYAAKLDEIDSLSRKRIQEAVHEAERIAQDIKKNAQQDAEKAVQKSKQEIDRQINEAKREIRNQVSVLSIDVAEKLLERNLSDDENQKYIQKVLSDMNA